MLGAAGEALAAPVAGAAALVGGVGRGLAVGARSMWSGVKGMRQGRRGLNVMAALHYIGGLIMRLASVSATVLAFVTAPIAALLGAIRAALNVRQARRASKRQSSAEDAFEEARLRTQQFEEWKQRNPAGEQTDESAESAEAKEAGEQRNTLFLKAVEYLAGKNKAKKYRKYMQASGGVMVTAGTTALAFGVAGAGVSGVGIAVSIAALTALLASNPVGWGIALGLVGAGLIMAIGYYIYMMVKSLVKWYRGGKEGGKGVNRRKHAWILWNLAANEDYELCVRFLREISIIKKSPTDTKGMTLEEFKDDENAAIDFLMRKMASV